MAFHSGDDANAVSPAVPGPICYILKCPPEIIMMFSEALGDRMASRSAFSQSCRTIQAVTEDIIYRDDVRYHQASATTWAASSGSLATLKKSVARGANLLMPHGGRSLLHDAAAHGHDAVVEYLLDNGINIHKEARACKCKGPCNLPGEKDWIVDRRLVIPGRAAPIWTALHVAICKGHLSTAKLLMDHGALENPSHPLLLRQMTIRQAAALGQHQLFDQILLGRETEIQAIIGVTKRPEHLTVRRPTISDYGALSFALSPAGNLETIDALVKLGADINERPHLGIIGEYEKSLIDKACSRKYLAMANALFGYGARPESWNGVNGCNRHLRTVLELMVWELRWPNAHRRKIEIQDGIQYARSLVAAGADFYHEYTETVVGVTQESIVGGINRGPTNPSGLVESAWACSERDVALSIMAFFLEMGATVGEVDIEGKTALTVLIEGFTMDMWRPPGSKVVTVDENNHMSRAENSNQLHVWPRERRLFAAVQLLLQHGASPMSPAKGYSGQTIMELVIDQFPLMDHNYHDHTAARAGINAVKLVMLFLDYQHSSDLSFHTVAVLDTWARDAIAAMQKKPPVTNLSRRDMKTFCLLPWYGGEEQYEIDLGRIPGNPAGETTQKPYHLDPDYDEELAKIMDNDESYWAMYHAEDESEDDGEPRFEHEDVDEEEDEDEDGDEEEDQM